MANRGNKCFGLVAGLLVISILAGGCHRESTPGTKQARLIAAENIQLKRRLVSRDGEVDKLKTQHAKDLRQREAQLAACRKRIQTLESDLQKGIAERVSSVTTAVVDENAKLRREVERLRAEIEKLKAKTVKEP